MALKQVGLRLEDELIERIDRARGSVARGQWIAQVCEDALAPATVRASAPARRAPADPRGVAMERQARLNKAKGM